MSYHGPPQPVLLTYYKLAIQTEVDLITVHITYNRVSNTGPEVDLSLYCSLIISYMSYHGPPQLIAHSIISYMSYHGEQYRLRWTVIGHITYNRVSNTA